MKKGWPNTWFEWDAVDAADHLEDRCQDEPVLLCAQHPKGYCPFCGCRIHLLFTEMDAPDGVVQECLRCYATCEG